MTKYFLKKFSSITNSSKIALVTKDNEEVTWETYFSKCAQFSNSLNKIKIGRDESIAIMGFNAPEWFYTAIGTIMYGVPYVGIYPTNGQEEVNHILDLSNSSILVIQNHKLLDNLKINKRLKKIIMYEEEPKKIEHNEIPLTSFNKFINDSKKTLLETNRNPNSIITYIMTSGTTGKSKAVKISYENISFTCSKICEIYKLDNERILSFLPLSHIAASMLDMFIHFYHQGTTYFAKPDALQGTLVDSLKIARPTCFLGVPRVWEKISEKMQEAAAKKYSTLFGKILKIVMDFVKEKTLNYHNGTMNNEEVSYWTSFIYNLSRRIFFNKIKSSIGFGDCKYFFSGAAPISKDTLDYFSKIDIVIYEIFGMSETCGVITASSEGNYRKGSVGKPLIGKVKIAKDGEILYQGSNNFLGYKKNKDATSETLDKDNWLHTGDIGTIDKDGYLYITGRKKELIITAGGENVAPVIIENLIKKNCPQISQIVIIGDRKKYLTALVTLPINELPKKIDEDAKNIEQSVKSKKWNDYVQSAINKYNEKPISNAQKIQKFTILNEDFTIQNDLMTPTMKLKRSKIAQRFEKEIEKMY